MDFTFTYRKLRHLFLLLSFLFLKGIVFGQYTSSGGLSGGSDGTYSMFPVDTQFYPRNPQSNIASISIVFNVTANVTNVRLRVFRDDNNDGDYVDANEEKTPVVFGNGPISVNTTYQIPAELNTYKFMLVCDQRNYLSRELITAGDAYYIQGQSNAEAKPVSSTDVDVANGQAALQGSIPGNGGARRYIRVFGGGTSSQPRWWLGDANKNYNSEGNLGQFGMRIGERIVREKGIPVCIMNGAELGHPISYFQKNSTDVDGSGLNNYQRELSRLTQAGLKDHIRAVIWFQGESNTYNGTNGVRLSTSNYISQFMTLQNSWDTDLGQASEFYILQIRPGCFDFAGGETSSSVLAIQEAERQLPLQDSRINLISTNNLPKNSGDNCHYYYEVGYKKIGDRVYNLINRDFYGGTLGNGQITPVPTTIEFSNRVGLTQEATQVAIHFSQATDNFAIVGDIRPSFVLEGGSYNITNATLYTNPSTLEKTLKLDFTKNSGTTNNPTGLSFYSNQLNASPSFANGNGDSIGLISFYNFPLALGILPVDPLNLRINSSEGRNTLVWEADNNPMFAQFIIERGVTANEFTAIASIQGNLKSGKVTYQQLDFKPNAARNYYRIKAIKIDGKELYSQVVAVNNRTSSVAGISVYPNPVSDRANVSLTLKKAGPATLQIFDPSGRMVATRQLNLQKGNNMFSAGELLDQSAGIYTIRVVTSEEVFNARVVRVK